MRNVVVLVALIFSACYRDTSPPPVPANKVDRTLEADVADELAFLPKDAEIVVGIDLVRLRQSALFETIGPQLASRFDKELRRLQTCGLDPMTSVAHIALGARKVGTHNHGVFVVRGVDGVRARKCIEEAAKQDPTLRLDGDVAFAQLSDGSKLVMTMVNSTTAIIVAAPNANRELLQHVRTSGAPLRESRGFMRLLARREPAASIWFMVNGNAELMAEIGRMGVSPRSFDGTLTVTDTLTGVLRLGFSSEEEAAKLVASVTPMLTSAQAMIERVDLRADGAMARFDIQVTEQQAHTIAGMLGVLLP